MDNWQIVILALVQGVTEFLPISSSAHLILPSALLGWQDQGLGFDIAVHAATLLAVVLYTRRVLWQTSVGFFSAPLCYTNQDTRRGYLLIIATIPAVLLGFFAKDTIATWARNEFVIATTTLIFGVLLGVAHYTKKENRTLADMTIMAALIIGLAQALALIPGTSRSGITLTAALLLGFRRTDAAHFSFLLAIPLIAGAGILLLGDLLAEQITLHWAQLSLAFVVACLSALLTLWLFMRIIEGIGLLPFVIYRIILALLLFAYILL